MLPEELLIEQCRKGKQAAQEELYDRFSAAMLSICTRYCGNRTEAEDVLQEGFIKIFRNIYDFKAKNEGSLAAWIKKIMVNTALSYLREKKRFSFIEDIETVPIRDQEDVLFDENEIVSPSSQELMKMISELPDGYKLVFNLYVIENYGHKEIASLLGITEGTSKSQLSKARALLQKKVVKWAASSKKKLLLAV
jgi:RNA polymerase sigma-70 factor (ECF subfamily)